MVAGWTRFATDECPRCLSTDVESSSAGRRCRRCGASLESRTARAPLPKFHGNAAQAEEEDFGFNPKIAILLVVLLLMLALFAAGRVPPHHGIENTSCAGNCIAGNMASL